MTVLRAFEGDMAGFGFNRTGLAQEGIGLSPRREEWVALQNGLDDRQIRGYMRLVRV